MSTITSVEHAVLQDGPRQLVFVRIRDSDGVVGYGEATLSGQTEAVRALLTTFADYLGGQPSDRITHHWQYLFRGFLEGWFYAHDCSRRGRNRSFGICSPAASRCPLYQLFGGATRERIRVYTHLGGHDAEQVAGPCPASHRRGLAHSQIFSDPWGMHPSPLIRFRSNFGVCKRHVRAVGDDIGLCYDCHGRFGFQDSLRMARRPRRTRRSVYRRAAPPRKIAISMPSSVR